MTRPANVVSATDAVGFTQRFSYDANGRVTNTFYLWVNPENTSDVRLVRSRNVYNADGLVVRTIDTSNNERTMAYDPMGKLTEVTEPEALPI